MNSKQAHSPASIGQELEAVLMNLSVMERRIVYSVENMRADLIVLRERLRQEASNKKPGALATG